MRFQFIEMPETFLAPFVVVDTNRHPVNFTEISNDDLDDDRVVLFDIADEAIAHAEFCNTGEMM